MKKSHLQPNLFQAGRRQSVKGVLGSLALGAGIAGVCGTAGIHVGNAVVSDTKNIVAEPTPVVTDSPDVIMGAADLALLRDVVKHLNLTPAQVNQLCKRYALPRGVLNTTDNTIEREK